MGDFAGTHNKNFLPSIGKGLIAVTAVSQIKLQPADRKMMRIPNEPLLSEILSEGSNVGES